jgi:endonuclease/exonuclease/phosphatase family metal-dependent hydrolase
MASKQIGAKHAQQYTAAGMREETMMDYARYPRPAVEDIARLRRRIERSGLPGKVSDHNLLVGTWNIRHFGEVYPEWGENPGSPKRNQRALAYILEIVRRLDVIAIQEVKRDLSGIRMLLEWLGLDWGLIITDVTAGSAGNAERLGFIFDRRRVQPSGLAGEIVLPPTNSGDPATQFARTPYAVGFTAGVRRFTLLTAHIKYGGSAAERTPELLALASHVAHEMRDRALHARTEEENIIVLGDFNIETRADDPLFKAFTSTGLVVPDALIHLRTTYGTVPKYYDQIAWFMEAFDLGFAGRAGTIDFSDALFPQLTRRQLSYRVSDHLPLWVEFILDRSEEAMAVTLGLDPGMPDPLSNVVDEI